MIAEPPNEIISRSVSWKAALRNTAYILAALIVFFFALDLMISSLEQVGKPVLETIILATSNPFTGLFIGLLATAIIQSSSAATSVVVALVASRAITIEGAVPIIMGANVGTTITSALVSLGFITSKKEFKRAVAAGTYHSIFNILTVVVLFPAEYYYGFLSGASEYLAVTFFNEPIGPLKSEFSFLGSGFGSIVSFLIEKIGNGIVLIVISVALIFGSILFFRKALTGMLGLASQERFQKFFFRSPIKSFAWGVLTTAAIRSSTVTTSLVVPLVAKKIVKLRAAVPFILGANIGTTITAFIAAIFNSNAAISIAIAHFLFNFIGVLIFFPISYLKEIPINLSVGLGQLAMKHRFVGFLYLLLTFFIIPFSLIFISRDNIVVRELTYEESSGGVTSTHRIISKTYSEKMIDWRAKEIENAGAMADEKLISIYRRRNLLLFRNELFEFNLPGYCRDGIDNVGSFKVCVRSVIQRPDPDGTQDSVYVFQKMYADSSRVEFFVSPRHNAVVESRKISKTGEILNSEMLKAVQKR